MAFWSVVVMNCVQPVNWGNCGPVHEWLPPYIEDMVDFMYTEPYEVEKKYLEETI
jgi:hypothetical protein